MPPICLITALPAEARPLMSHFGLRALAHRHLRLYQGDLGYLLQCGVGKLNAAAATGAMLQSLPDVAAIINVGIAGSHRPIGEVLIAHAVKDTASSQQWYPHLPPVKRLLNTSSVQVLTVDKPAADYAEQTAFDMEAAGIFNAASKVLDLAFVHSIKVVSDNAESGVDSINAKTAMQNIEYAIPVVDALTQALPFDSLPSNNAVDSLSQWLTKRIHYTATEQHSLHQLLHRYNALFGELPNEAVLQDKNNAKDIRKMLLSEIDNASVSY